MRRGRTWYRGAPLLGALAIGVFAFGLSSHGAPPEKGQASPDAQASKADVAPPAFVSENAAKKAKQALELSPAPASPLAAYSHDTALRPAGEVADVQIERSADLPGGGTRGGLPCPVLTYDNGTYNFTNGTRPTIGWTQAGAIDDFETTTGVAFTCVQAAMFDNTGGAELQTMRVQIFDLNNIDGAGGGDGSLAGMGSYATAVNVCDNTYSVGAGTLTLTDTGDDAFGHDVLLLDGTGVKCTLPPGDYGFHLMFPGTDAVDFWATANQAGVSPDCVHIWGPGVDAPGSADCVGGPEFLYMDFKLYQGLGNCGDGTCDGAEDCCNCPEDCFACVCGDGTCSSCEDCAGCPGDCGDCPVCDVAVGDCCVPHDSPGCDDPACCEAVCAFDGTCCQPPPQGFNWDAACVTLATSLPECGYCGQTAWNDNCEDVTPDPLAGGGSVVWTGNNTLATVDCAALGVPEVWHAFTTTETLDVTIAYCGTDPPFGNGYIVLDQSCPCSGTFVYDTSHNQDECADGNWTMHWDALPAGTYYWPLMSEAGSQGPYTVTLSAPLPPVGACCTKSVPDPGFGCTCTPDMSANDCAVAGGSYVGDGTTCDPNPLDPCDCNNNGECDANDVGGDQKQYVMSPNVGIPDADATGVRDEFFVPDSGVILDLVVDLDISHTWIGDLCVTIEKKSGDGTGAAVTVIQRIGDTTGLGCDAVGCCGCDGDNIPGIFLDDAATAPINAACPPAAGASYIPESPLSAFDGLDKQGTWSITVNDNAGGDTGILHTWSLHFTNEGAGPTSEDCDSDGVPDECEQDCDDNGTIDDCEDAADCNENGKPDNCDVADGVSEDCNQDGVPDECQLGYCGRDGDRDTDNCQVDDGTTENGLGLTTGGEMAWIQECTATAGASTVVAVSTVWGYTGGTPGVDPGETVRVYVWNDPNQDGNPDDAVLQCETYSTADAASIGTDVFQKIILDCPVAFAPDEKYFIGASAVHLAGEFPSPMDENGVMAHMSWVHFNDPAFDPNNMGGVLNMDCVDPPVCDFVFTANWLLRANAVGGACNDEDGDGIPDDCHCAVDGDCTDTYGCCWDQATGDPCSDPNGLGCVCIKQVECDGGAPCKSNPTICTDQSTECTNVDCDWENPQADADGCVAVNKNAGFNCGNGPLYPCDAQDTCDGAGTCVDVIEPDATPCDDGEDCTDPDTCTGGVCSGVNNPILFADISMDYCPPICPQPNLDDITCVLEDFADGPAVNGCLWLGRGTTDLAPCGGNGQINVDDILSVLDAFGQVFNCPHPCPP